MKQKIVGLISMLLLGALALTACTTASAAQAEILPDSSSEPQVSSIAPAPSQAPSQAPSSSSMPEEEPEPVVDFEGLNILVLYHSKTGNTEELAGIIQEYTGADTATIEPVDPYPTSYEEVVDQVEREIDEGYLPPILSTVQNLEQYDVILLGSPIWFSTVSLPIKTFLTENDLSGKVIIPFSTNGGGNDGGVRRDVRELSPGATVLAPFTIDSDDMDTAPEAVAEWFSSIGLMGEELVTADANTSATATE